MAPKLINICGNSFYIDGAVNIGVVTNDKKEAIIIDSGSDDDTAKKIIRLLDEQGMKITTIINTHSHADHCGGNSLISNRTKAKIFAPHFEKAIIEYPELEPFYLYSAAPLKQLDVKFLKAKPSIVDSIITPGEIEINGIKLNIIDLSGHSPGMIGVVSEDNVAFVADSFFSEDILNKYKLPFFSDIKNTLKTFENLESMNCDYYLPCHGTLLTDLKQAVNANRKAIFHVIELIKGFTEMACDREEIIAKIIMQLEIAQNIPQYYLTLATVSAFLSFLSNEGIISPIFEDNRLKFKK